MHVFAKDRELIVEEFIMNGRKFLSLLNSGGNQTYRTHSIGLTENQVSELNIAQCYSLFEDAMLVQLIGRQFRSAKASE